MIELIALFIVGCAVVLVGLLTLLRKPKWANQNPNLADELRHLVNLPAVEFRHFSRVFSDADYRVLSANPRLYDLARQLRRDRRRIALDWLSSLRRDVSALWRFRRLLVRYGASRGVTEEFATFLQACLIIGLIESIRVCVFLVGPFALTRVVALGRQRVQLFSERCSSGLQFLPKNHWLQFAEEWRRIQTQAQAG